MGSGDIVVNKSIRHCETRSSSILTKCSYLFDGADMTGDCTGDVV